MNKVILASGSPRRKELFETLNIPFDIKVSNVDESLDANLSICENIEALSFRKEIPPFPGHRESCRPVLPLLRSFFHKRKHPEGKRPFSLFRIF